MHILNFPPQHDPNDEPSTTPIAPDFFAFDLEKDELSRDELKELLYKEIMAFRPRPFTTDGAGSSAGTDAGDAPGDGVA